MLENFRVAFKPHILLFIINILEYAVLTKLICYNFLQDESAVTFAWKAYSQMVNSKFRLLKQYQNEVARWYNPAWSCIIFIQNINQLQTFKTPNKPSPYLIYKHFDPMSPFEEQELWLLPLSINISFLISGKLIIMWWLVMKYFFWSQWLSAHYGNIHKTHLPTWVVLISK